MKLVIKAPNMMAANYARLRLKENYGINTLGDVPLSSNIFVMVSPCDYMCRGHSFKTKNSTMDTRYVRINGNDYRECEDCIKLREDKPILCEASEITDTSNAIDLYSALLLINLSEKKIK